jgi:hypothetical protein
VILSVHPVESQNYLYVERAELIFNPRTYQYIGNILLYGGFHAPISSTLVTTRFVDSAPAVPSHAITSLPECVAFI